MKYKVRTAHAVKVFDNYSDAAAEMRWQLYLGNECIMSWRVI